MVVSERHVQDMVEADVWGWQQRTCEIGIQAEMARNWNGVTRLGVATG